MNWKELLPTYSAAAAWWSAERLRMLDEYIRLAEANQRRGRWEAAVGYLEEALRKLPDMPEPRRRQLKRHIQNALEMAARSALQQAPPDLQAARRHLEHAARSVGDPGLLAPLGLVAHLAGDAAAALRWYERATAAGQASRALAYGRRLAQLQLAAAKHPAPDALGATDKPAPAEKPVAPGATGAGDGRLAPAVTAVGDRLVASGQRPATEGPALPGAPAIPTEALHPLEAAAWRRLAALAGLAHGDLAQALAWFPAPSDPELPAAWALEGALIAALNENWPVCLAYYRRAQAQGVTLTRAPHVYVFAAAWLCADDGNGEGVPFPEPSLRERAPKNLFVDPAQYQDWRLQFLRWQYRWWLSRARTALARGDDRDLQHSLMAAVRILPQARLSKAIDAWLACAYGATRPPKLVGEDELGEDTTALLRLSVWVAERFGTPIDVIRQLTRLLERYPQDPWGLARWKRWMIRLGQEAIAQGRFRQALLQFVSLLLHLPDDPDGWRWCARLHAELGDAARAADCASEVHRLAERTRRRLKPEGAAGGDLSADATPATIQGGSAAAAASGVGNDAAAARDGASDGGLPVEYGLIEALLQEPDDGAGESVPPFAFSPRALTEAVWASVRSGDAYLEFLVQGWVRSAGSVARMG
ncbi:MAG TPA: hypothetical protein VIK93_02480 [Limnochordales bacterium]